MTPGVGTPKPRGKQGGVTKARTLGTQPGISALVRNSRQRPNRGGTRPITVGTKAPKGRTGTVTRNVVKR